MNRPLAPRLGWAVTGFALLLVVLCEVVGFLTPSGALPRRIWPPIYDVELLLVASSFAIIGGLIVSRHPRNGVGWICLAIALVGTTNALIIRYSLVAVFDPRASLPAGLWAAWVVQWAWVPFEGLIVAFLPALFPDGRLLSSRWQAGLWLIVVGNLVVMAAAALYPQIGLWTPGVSCVWGPAIPGPCFQFRNPLAVTVPHWLLDVAIPLSGVLDSAALVVCSASLIARFRQGNREVRAQLKWLSSAIGLCTFSIASMFVLGNIFHVSVPALWMLAMATFLAIPLAIGFAILKYRLYDIDVVINRSLIFGALAAFITTVYIGIVAGLGSLIGTGGRPNLALSILATAVVAVAFQPVRERVERLANRVVYGRRATPYEVLAQFTERVSGTYASEEILPRMAEVLAQGTSAARADVWLRVGDHIAPAASWSSDNSDVPAIVGLDGQLLPSIAGATRTVPVRHQGDLLGALSIRKRPGEALTPVEEDLLKSLSAQAGLVLRNVRLTAELRARLNEISAKAAELRASRQRIVAAQDAERRRLERDIHDGAQQNLVALTVKLRLAISQARTNPARAAISVTALQGETKEALQTLRDLARGIYPPLLREQGVGAALKAHAARIPGRIEVSANGLGRPKPDIEAALYFCCLEALQNATKHAAASNILVKLEQQGADVLFSVVDDGVGIEERAVINGSGLQNMKDRVEALGGRLTVGGAPGAGTRVTGRIPATIGRLHA